MSKQNCINCANFKDYGPVAGHLTDYEGKCLSDGHEVSGALSECGNGMFLSKYGKTENNWYNTHEPFNLEVEIVDDSMRKTVEDIVLRSVVKGTELLPGLRVNKAYKQSLDRQDVLSSAMKDEFEELMKTTQDAFSKFFKKWNKDENPLLQYAQKIDNPVIHIDLPYTDVDGYPTNISNCYKNCKKCHNKCMYRKEPAE